MTNEFHFCFDGINENEMNERNESEWNAAPRSQTLRGKPLSLPLSFVGPLKRHQKERRKRREWMSWSSFWVWVMGCGSSHSSAQRRRTKTSNSSIQSLYLFNQTLSSPFLSSFLFGLGPERKERKGVSVWAPAAFERQRSPIIHQINLFQQQMKWIYLWVMGRSPSAPQTKHNNSILFRCLSLFALLWLMKLKEDELLLLIHS